MKALISGQAGIAVLADGGHFLSFTLDEITPSEWQNQDLSWLFGACSDVRSIDCDSREQLLAELELAWQQDRSLHLTLLLLNSQEESDIRRDAAECLDEFLSKSLVEDFVANRLYSKPLPDQADLPGAMAIAEGVLALRVRGFLYDLSALQLEISKRYAAWLALPESLFGGTEYKERFEAEALEAGAFRLFVTEQGKSDRALFQMLVHPLFRGRAVARRVLQEWAAPFKETIDNVVFAAKNVDDPDFQEQEVIPWVKGASGTEIFRRVESQKAAIKKLLSEGDRERAYQFTQQLVDDQRRNSQREQIAKSLCDLASFVKKLGDPGLQLVFSIWAVREAPEDAWSHGQAGEAYRAVGEYDKAMDEFALAGSFGDERTALLGRAQIHKDLGQLEEALIIFDRCVERFPDDVVSRNGRAAALADFGRFTQALDLYNALCNESLADVVSLSGRAEVYRDMGQLDKALGDLDSITSMFPNDQIPHCARGEVLREMGRLNEALQWFRETASRFPLSMAPKNGAAKVLRDMGAFDDALQAYRQIAIEFPLDQTAHIGIAEVEKRRGALGEALSTFKLLKDRFPRSSIIRNGLAAVLAAQGLYDQARSLLPDHLPASRGEWVAYHIRGMICLRSGEIEKAATIFEDGMARIPWSAERTYFQTALASVEVQRSRYRRAIELLSAPVAVAVKPIAAVIKMHAHAALGESAELQSAYINASGTQAPLIVSLRERLVMQLGRQTSQMPTLLDGTLFEQECDALLMAA